MNDLEHIGYQREVIEFVAVAKEYCNYLESSHEENIKELLSKVQKFIPLIYLKGCLLPACESDNLSIMEEAVSEDDYNALHAMLHHTLGEHDEYLEVFDDNMQYSEAPIVNSISEKLCDIYQDLKNFISAYRSGMIDVIEEALWQLNNSFELYWGKACASVLRAIHLAIYKVADTDDSM